LEEKRFREEGGKGERGGKFCNVNEKIPVQFWRKFRNRLLDGLEGFVEHGLQMIQVGLVHHNFEHGSLQISGKNIFGVWARIFLV
jgi:hypothetical protein